MRITFWQFFVALGIAFILVKLLIDFLIPMGVAFLLIGLILYFVEASSKPKMIKK